MPQFLILATDYTDDKALERRLSVREAHLARMRDDKAAGIFIAGGAKLDDSGKMCGSMILVSMENEQAATDWMNKDPYATGKVWEVKTVTPFRLAEV